ncbi:MAG: hypothetical protein FWE03_05620 [Firmicutes bacterium]|nr:hypothetical protein [Bacillota bacterium]
MVNKNKKVYNSIIMALRICAIIRYIRPPKDIIIGSVKNKRRIMMSQRVMFPECYVTIETKELMVSQKIYELLSVGDYISAAYRKDLMNYFCYVDHIDDDEK